MRRRLKRVAEGALGGGVVSRAPGTGVQDIRGLYRSEGGYAMYRVPRGALNSKCLALMDEVAETDEPIVITLL